MDFGVFLLFFCYFWHFTVQKIPSGNPREPGNNSTILEHFSKIPKLSKNQFCRPQSPQKTSESKNRRFFVEFGVIFAHICSFMLFLAFAVQKFPSGSPRGFEKIQQYWEFFKKYWNIPEIIFGTFGIPQNAWKWLHMNFSDFGVDYSIFDLNVAFDSIYIYIWWNRPKVTKRPPMEFQTSITF